MANPEPRQSYSFVAQAPILFILILVALAGNLSLLSPYHLYSDEYSIFAKSLTDWLHNGLWRIAGMMLIKWLVAFGIYGIAAILIHALTGYFLYLTALHAFTKASYALLIAVLFVAFPWSYQAMVWAACACFVLATFISIVVIYLLVSVDLGRRSPLPRALTVAALSFFGLLTSESAFFVFCAAGGAVATQRRFEVRRDFPLLLAPLAGAGLWAVLYKVMEPANPFKQIGALNFRALLSPIYYQYSNLEVFDVWLVPAFRHYALSTVGTRNLILAAAIVCALLPLIWIVLRRFDRDDAQAPQRTVPWRFAVFAVAVLFGSAAIYVLGGGYSLDSHKRYGIAMHVILAAGAVGWWLWGVFLAAAKRPWRPMLRLRPAIAIVMLLTVVGCATSLMMMSVWQRELARIDALLNTVVTERLSGPVTVDWNPYIHDVWPLAERSWGIPFDAEWVWELGFKFGYGISPPVTAVRQGGRMIRWDGASGRWQMP